jgi:hypothetical protein
MAVAGPELRVLGDARGAVVAAEKVIDLLARVTRVSVETQRIVGEMKDAAR